MSLFPASKVAVKKPTSYVIWGVKVKRAVKNLQNPSK